MTAPLPPVTPPTPAATPIGVNARISLRRAWAQEWARANPVLRDGEPGIDKTANMLKVGDGKTPWLDLPYLKTSEGAAIIVGDGASDSAIAAHIRSSRPHPAYDDGPSLVLLYQNAKV